jgi:hypothetical protein
MAMLRWADENSTAKIFIGNFAGGFAEGFELGEAKEMQSV